jgi:abhydrolase domain-containing protein 1/3
LLLTNYVAAKGRDTHLVGAMAISAAWDVFATSKVLEEPLNALLFNRHLTENLLDHLTKSE